MAKLMPPATVNVELTPAELALVRRALGLVHNFGDPDDWEPAERLREDLEPGE
ncbi:hypothetical protein [Kitasatospora sp. NPDC101183]|uniref:hypothetical protein n=1 Tax=Kitasatospora sp. NPDC101183 TaxID=3364100 RepID=UPI0038265596